MRTETTRSRAKRPDIPWVVLAVVPVLAVVMGIVSWTLVDARRAARRQFGQEAANITLSLERDILRAVGALDRSIQTAARATTIPGFATMDPIVRRALLFDGSIDSFGGSGVFIADSRGQIIYDSLGPVPRNVNIADRDYFQAHRDNARLGLVISQPLRGRHDNKISIAFARRLDNPDGSFAGVTVAGLPISYFTSLFSGFDIGKDAVINLVTTDEHRLVTRFPFDESEIGRPLTSNPALEMLGRETSGTFEAASQIDGTTRIGGFREIGDLALVVVVGKSTHEVFAEWRRRAAILVGVVLLLAAIKFGLAWTLQRELRRRALAEEAEREAARVARRSEVELARAMAPIDALFQHTADLMLVLRVQPDGDFVYEAVNPSAERVLGVSAGAAIDGDPRSTLAAEILEPVVAGLRACVRDRRPTRAVFSCRPAGERDREWEAMVFPIAGADETVDRLIVVGRDITERNQLEANLSQARKMEVVGRLAAGVSHDFNNILQVIGGGIETLRDESELSEQARELLDMIDRSARRGASLTHHLLAYSRKQALNPRILDLRELLGHISLVLSRTLGAHISVTVAFEPSVGTVKADRSQLETALMNLAINASEAMPDGGVLGFAIRGADSMRFGELLPGRHVVIAVTDTGTGMARDVMDRIFDPFFTTKGLKGTGLGLAMVHGFCRQSGGDVRVISSVGHGTRFEIWLPEVQAVMAHPVAMQTKVEPSGNGHVLLVDDAPDVLITLSAFLRAAGFTATPVAGGREALALLAAGTRFDLLVTDYQMPSIQGPELIERARAIQPDLPAIIVSGYADVTEFTTGLTNVVMLNKPFQRDQFIAQVDALMTHARREMLSEAVEHAGPNVSRQPPTAS